MRDVLTIKEALDQNDQIKIQYVFVCQCKVCKDKFLYCDQEYSFKGNSEDFEKFTRSYDVLDLEDKVEHITEDIYRYFGKCDEEELCQVCKSFL